jgi:protocatechuate 3,4-dioxygenase beta subunit
MLLDPKFFREMRDAGRWRFGPLALAGAALLALSVLTLPPASLVHADEPKAKSSANTKPAPAREMPKKSPAHSGKQPAPGTGVDLTVSGRVENQDQKPVATAPVAVVAFASNGGTANAPQVLGQTRTDSKGRFQLAVKKADPTHQVVVLASAKGFALGWHFIQPRADALIKLKPEHAIRGRLIDLQGQPASGVKVRVCRVGNPTPDQGGLMPGRSPVVILSTPGGKMQAGKGPAKPADPAPLRFLEPPADLPLWPKTVTTDAKGYFTLAGIPQGQGVGLQVRDPRFAIQALAIPPQKKGKSQVVTLILAQARVLEGRVVDASTGKPIPHARLHIPAPPSNRYLSVILALDSLIAGGGEADWKGRRNGSAGTSFAFETLTQGPPGDNLPAIQIQTDREGRYKIPLFLAESYAVNVSAPAGQPYFAMSRTVNWPSETARKELEVSLPRGVWVQGKVTEAPSGKAVAGARIDFWAPGLQLPEGVGFPAPLNTGADGAFRILLPPGSWKLLVNGSATYVYQKIAAARVIGTEIKQVNTSVGSVFSMDPANKKQFFYPDGWAALDLKPRADTQKAGVQLRRATLKGKLIGPDGKPVARAVLFYRHPVPAFPQPKETPTGPNLSLVMWGQPPVQEPAVAPVEVRNGQFELPVRDLEAKYRLYFLDARNNLGAIAEISARDKAPTVRMKACASAQARFLDARGKPKAKYPPQLFLLLAPGPHAGEPLAVFDPGRRPYPLVAVVKGRNSWDWTTRLPAPTHDRILLSVADPGHYGKEFVTDARGKITFPTLIPGATYRLALPDGKVKDFKAEAGKTVDLKDFAIPDPPRPAKSLPIIKLAPIIEGKLEPDVPINLKPRK